MHHSGNNSRFHDAYMRHEGELNKCLITSTTNFPYQAWMDIIPMFSYDSDKHCMYIQGMFTLIKL